MDVSQQGDDQKGSCRQCGGHLEFPRDGIGQEIECPHCGQRTVLTPAVISSSPLARRSRWVWFAAVLVVLAIAGTISAYLRLKRNDEVQVSQPLPLPGQADRTNLPPSGLKQTRPKSLDDLHVTGQIRLEKTPNSGLVYAVGTLKNDSDYQRFGVRIELDLLDEQDTKLGGAADYVAELQPHSAWRFRALLTEPKTAKVSVAAIKEE